MWHAGMLRGLGGGTRVEPEPDLETGAANRPDRLRRARHRTEPEPDLETGEWRQAQGGIDEETHEIRSGGGPGRGGDRLGRGPDRRGRAGAAGRRRARRGRRRRRGDRRRRPRGGRLGRGRDDGSADPVHPHRGDRRRGPLRAAGPAGRGLRGVRAGLRPRRLGTRPGDAGAEAGPRRGGGPRPAGRGAGLSRRLVAVDDGAARGRALAAGARELGDRVPELPPDRQQGDP